MGEAFTGGHAMENKPAIARATAPSFSQHQQRSAARGGRPIVVVIWQRRANPHTKRSEIAVAQADLLSLAQKADSAALDASCSS